jgi:hypothetical protein
MIARKEGAKIMATGYSCQFRTGMLRRRVIENRMSKASMGGIGSHLKSSAECLKYSVSPISLGHSHCLIGRGTFRENSGQSPT